MTINERRYWRIVWPDKSSRVGYMTRNQAMDLAGQMQVFGDTPKPLVKVFRPQCLVCGSENLLEHSCDK